MKERERERKYTRYLGAHRAIHKMFPFRSNGSLIHTAAFVIYFITPITFPFRFSYQNNKYNENTISGFFFFRILFLFSLYNSHSLSYIDSFLFFFGFSSWCSTVPFVDSCAVYTHTYTGDINRNDVYVMYVAEEP